MSKDSKHVLKVIIRYTVVLTLGLIVTRLILHMSWDIGLFVAFLAAYITLIPFIVHELKTRT